MTRLTDCDLEQLYCEMLDEVYGTVKIAGLEYKTSSALKGVDPTAFRCGFNDWLDAELGGTIWEKDGEYFDSDPELDDAAVFKRCRDCDRPIEHELETCFACWATHGD